MKIEYRKIIEEVFSRNFWTRISIMVLATFILAVNYNLFLLSNNFVIGGSSGIATILNANFGITPSTFIFIFNLFLIILSFLLIGPKQTGQTIIGSLLYPLFVSLTSNLCLNISHYFTFDNFLIVVIITGLLFGCANGFIYKTGFTTGGCDILIQIVNKYFKIPTGSASMAVNFLIISLGAYSFGLTKAVYALLVIFMNSFLIDRIMLGISDSKMFYIHTKKSKEVIDFISSMKTGYTLIKTEGGYSKEENDIIMCVIRTKDYYMFSNVIKEIDSKAFLVISDCYQVYGGKRQDNFPFI